MAARTPRHIIEAIRDLIQPPDGSEGIRRTAKIIEEMERRRLGSPSKDIVRKVFFALEIEPERGPESAEPDRPRTKRPHPSHRRPAMGRPPGIHTQYSKLRERARELRAEKKTAIEIAAELECARTYVYKLLSDED